jgi:hypothetical protein
MHFNGSKKVKRYGMTAGGKTKGKVLIMERHQGKLNDETKVYSLCSEGNRRIIQSSYDKERLQTIADMLNQEQELMTGVKYEKFFILTPL